MPLTIEEITVPIFTRCLTSLSGILQKGAAHAEARKIDPSALLTARLFPDMFTFTRQVQATADFPKTALSRIIGIEPPKYEDTEKSFDELIARVARTLEFVRGVDMPKLHASGDKDITFPVGAGRTMTLSTTGYVLNFVMPNFYFHMTAAYSILRHNGVELGKRDFLGAS